MATKQIELSPDRLRLLNQILKSQGDFYPEKEDSPAAGAESILSFAQQRLWFLDQFEPGDPVFNLTTAIRLKGMIEIKALERSISEVVRRHQVLRTRFVTRDGSVTALVDEHHPLQLAVTDLSNLSYGQQQARLDSFIHEEQDRAFDLSAGRLLQARLFKLEPREHVLLVNMHHIVSDAWSAGIFSRELVSMYSAFAAGLERCPLPDLPLQYVDFARRQRSWLQGATLDRLLGYWRKTLAGPLPVLDLPTDRPRPPVLRHHGASVPLWLPDRIIEPLTSLARRHRASLFMALLAALHALLARYSGQDDILVGSPANGRTWPETRDLIGFFVNSLVFRGDLSGDPCFSELLDRTREVALGAYGHQDLPFEKLVEVLQPQRDLSRSPFFQVFLNLHPRAESVGIPSLETSVVPIEQKTTQFDLSLYLWEGNDGVGGRVEYNTDLYERETVERLVGHYERLLEGAAAEPQTRLSELNWMSEAERKKILVDWNQTARPFSQDVPVHELIERQATLAPDRIAVEGNGERLSYQELNARANQLAHFLRRQGVGPEARVGVCLSRTPGLLAALLAVWKAGAAYVPLDPAYPAERLEFMLADAAATALLSEGDAVEGLEFSGRLVHLDRDQQAIAAESPDNPPRETGGNNLAYLIYTSGSTGRPKGVMIEHRAVVNFLESIQREPGLSADDRLLAVTTVCFDIAVLELFLPLIVGARVILATREEAVDGVRLKRRLQEATVMQATPASWRLLLEAGWERSPGLKALCGGEALNRELANRLADRCKEVWNLYGPTETTVWSALQCVKSGEGVVWIGRPIDNTDIYVLDPAMRPLPAGVVGEIYIGGAGVARGYWKQPELTAQRFVDHPWRSGERLYRTGDLGRRRRDGRLECLGRQDGQIKLRGYRIELGEIEGRLEECEGVQEAAVVVWGSEEADKRLVGYVVAKGAEPPRASDLRALLSRVLPEYMLPTAYVVLDSLPRTPNGKINRRALPPPDQGQKVEAETGYVPPRDNFELRLASVWEQVLNTNPVGIHDDFFALGGHSVLAVRLFTEIERVFGRHLPIASLFQAPTVARLAAAMQQDGWTPPWSSLTVLQPGGSARPFFCVHSLGTNLVSYRRLADEVGHDQPFYGLQPKGLERDEQPHATVEEMAAHYVAEIRALQPKGPYALGGTCLGGVVAFEMARQLHAIGEQTDALVMIDSDMPGIPQHLPAYTLPYSFSWYVDYHLGAFLMLDASAKLRYAAERFHHGLRRIARLFKAAVSRRPAAEATLPAIINRIRAAHRRALSQYRAKHYPGRIDLFCCAEVPTRGYRDRRLAWDEVAGAGLEVHLAPGTHDTVVDYPHVRVLAAKLRAVLDRRSGNTVTLGESVRQNHA